MNRKPGKKAGLEKAAATCSKASAPSSGKRNWIYGLVLVLAVIVAYQPALRGGFIWDDDFWTTKILQLLRDFSGLRRMWVNLAALQQYYPLTGTTFWLDYHLWGLWPLPYHFENVLLHALAALLFWRLLWQLQAPAAWLAAAIFALHPLMVESAGWITERKNVLSLVFYLSALLAYGRFVLFWNDDKPSAAIANRTPLRRWGIYALAFFLFLCALLAKTTAFSLPAAILLICWWKRGRIRWQADVLPVLPFFALSISLCLVTAWLEKNHVGATGSDFSMTLPERWIIAGHAFWFYLGKLVWPASLCFVYPRWQLDATSLEPWFYPITAAGILLTLWLARRRIGRGPATALFFFVGTLFPVLGFMDAYFMRYSFVCDHWAYLSSLGPITLGAALVAQAAGRVRNSGVLYGFAAVVLPVLMLLTWRQAGIYRDIETVWRDTLAKNPDCWMAQNNLGLVLFERGNVDEAVAQYQKSLQIKPNHPEAQNNLGNALFRKGRVDEAIAHYQKALEIKPRDAVFQCNLGNALFRKGRVDEAIAHYQEALEINPDDAYTCVNLGNALFQKGRVDEAIAHYQKALQIKPNDPKAKNNLALLLATYPQASLRNGNRAVELAERANQLSGGKDPIILRALAAAYAEAGRFGDAIRNTQEAIKLAQAAGQQDIVEQLNGELKLYEAGLPLHQ